MTHTADLYRPMVDGQEVEDAVKETLELWMPDSLRYQEVRRGYTAGSLPLIRSFHVWPEAVPERWPEDQLPALAVGSPGTTGEPEADGTGAYRATWEVAVGVVVSAATVEATHKLSRVYGAAVRQSLLQHRSLGGFTRGLDWGGESYDAVVDANMSRSQAAALNAFTVTVGEVVNWWGGPDAPPDDPETDGFPYVVDLAEVDIEPLTDD